MASDDSTDLPKLPPIRESAEHVVPPLPVEQPGSAWEDVPEPAAAVPPLDADAERRERRKHRALASDRPQRKQTTHRREPSGARDPQEGRRGSRTEDGRRYSSAGAGLMVALLALLFGALLNAPGMHKASFNKKPGAGRDIALALTGGLAGISGALQLDRPRQIVQDVAGRSDADNINVAIVIPDTTAPTKNTTPKPTTSTQPQSAVGQPPAKPKFTPQKKLRLWVAGDSLVITPGYSIIQAAGASPVIDSVGGVEGRVATGLTRPDVFNWFQEIRARVKKLKPHVVVLNFGGNDDKAYMTGLPDGTTIGEFGDPAWQKEYRRRVAGVMELVNRAGGTVVWIGLPITRSEAQTQRYDIVNAVVQKEAKKRGSKAIFIDTYTMFAGDTGGFAEYLENAKGDKVKVRAGDGVHFDSEGGDIIAREVLKQLNTMFDLTSWRRTAS